MRDSSCLAEHDLLALAIGEPADGKAQVHLEACPDCRCRLESLQQEVAHLRQAARQTTVPATGASSSKDEASTGPVPHPSMIGKYPVVDVLDLYGGQALVYRALHPTLAGKELVIKLSRRPVSNDPGECDRLATEGRLLAELDHPNLVRVYDHGFHDGRSFLVLEQVHGRNLEQYVQSHPPTPKQAAELVAAIARALAVVHRRNIIHRDIKPRNILIDAEGRPRLIDFGMARLNCAWPDQISDQGLICGTPSSMAPEQARGEPTGADPRSDLFSLGTVLYFLLVGKTPFTAEKTDESLEHAAQCDFDRSALKNAGVPHRLEAICLRAMAPNPADRHASAEELAADLERFARSSERGVAKRFLVVGGFGLLALLIGGWQLWLANRSNPRQSPPTLPSRNLSFTLSQNYYVGPEPVAVVAADFNNDGFLDLAVTSYKTSLVNLLLGNGDGTFRLRDAEERVYPVGEYPLGLVAGDFNEDGNQDLAVACSGSEKVFLLSGDGQGGFQTTVTMETGKYAAWINVADLDLDGKLDLVVANSRSGTVSVLRGDGRGSFQKVNDYRVSKGPKDIALGHFNNDRRLDLVVAGGGAIRVVDVLLSKDGETFEEVDPYTINDGQRGRSPYSVVAADFNHDGITDLATANFDDGTVSVLLGKGVAERGRLFGPPHVYSTGGLGSSSLAVADFDGDGNLDLATPNDITGNVGILLGRRDGTFGSPKTFEVQRGPCYLAVGDFNRDGAPDIAVTNSKDATISVLLNTTSLARGKSLPIDESAVLAWRHRSRRYPVFHFPAALAAPPTY